MQIINFHRESLQELADRVLSNYEYMLRNRGAQRERYRQYNIRWIEIEKDDFHFWVCQDFNFQLGASYYCLLGLVVLPDGNAQRRWWWKSTSCGSWRAGIRLDDDHVHKGVEIEDLPEGHSYVPGVGYINESTAFTELQDLLEGILEARNSHQYFLNISFRQARNLANTGGRYKFLNEVVNGNIAQYSALDTLPEYYPVIAIEGALVPREYYADVMLYNSSSVINRLGTDSGNIDQNIDIDMKRYRNTARSFLEGMLAKISNEGPLYPHTYSLAPKHIGDVQVYRYSCNVRVGGRDDINELVFEIAASNTPKPEFTVIRRDKRKVFSVWVKQIYLLSARQGNITSFGNHKFFSYNLAGLIQKSADYEHQTTAVRNYKRDIPDRTPYCGERKGGYVHLARWNEKSNDLVRRFKQVMNLNSKYIVADEKEFEAELKLYIANWVFNRMLRSCDDYLEINDRPSANGTIRVKALKKFLLANDNRKEYIRVQNCLIHLIDNNYVGSVRYRGSTKSTRKNGYLCVLARTMRRSPNPENSTYIEIASNKHYHRWETKICRNEIGALWWNSQEMTPRKIIRCVGKMRMFLPE